MIVMPANNAKLHVGWLAGRYPGRIGHLNSPGSAKGPYSFIPYALDNGRFAAWSAPGREWIEGTYLGFLTWAKASGQKPLWALVPDVVADREATLAEWRKWAPIVAAYGWPLAFAVQDGMKAADVPSDAEVVFVGGSTRWKRRTLHYWCDHFDRVHVGRINTEKWLWVCDEAGAESCDGTGWYRGDPIQREGLERYLYRSANGYSREQKSLWVEKRDARLRAAYQEASKS